MKKQNQLLPYIVVAVLILLSFIIWMYNEAQNNKPGYDWIVQTAQAKVDDAPEFCSLSYVTCGNEKPSFKAVVSAYSELDSCHTGKSCLMANGKKAHLGAVACPRSIPLGSHVLIAGQRYTCEDRTAAWVDGRYDLFFGYGIVAHQKALEWGIKTLEVTIL
jgi:3D (Asp-Asp-Asp) domain-containing protein